MTQSQRVYYTGGRMGLSIENGFPSRYMDEYRDTLFLI